MLFAIIFYWTPPHFWALAIRYRDDYAAADVPMLPAVASLRTTAGRILFYTVLLWGLTLLFGPVAGMGDLYLVAALGLGGLFTVHAPSWCATRRRHQGVERRRAMRVIHLLDLGHHTPLRGDGRRPAPEERLVTARQGYPQSSRPRPPAV